MVYDHFSDYQIYKKTDSTLWQQCNEQNKKTNTEVSKYFNQARNRLLKKNSASTSNFNGLPQINKYALISKALAK